MGALSRKVPTVERVRPVKAPSDSPRSRILSRPAPRLVMVTPAIWRMALRSSTTPARSRPSWPSTLIEAGTVRTDSRRLVEVTRTSATAVDSSGAGRWASRFTGTGPAGCVVFGGGRMRRVRPSISSNWQDPAVSRAAASAMVKAPCSPPDWPLHADTPPIEISACTAKSMRASATDCGLTLNLRLIGAAAADEARTVVTIRTKAPATCEALG